MVRAQWRSPMPNENVQLIRTAYQAYAHGDLATMLGFVHPDLEWSYLDPSLQDPEPQVCHGRQELEAALERQAERGLRAELEEVLGQGDRVMVVVRTAGIDAYRLRQADDRNFSVLTVREGRIVALRDCRNREEAMAVVGVG
jgi:ketosteroid isomerase-like protein